MPIESLRAFLEQVEAQGDLLRIDGAEGQEEKVRYEETS
jgi:hypothetical protein